MTKEENQAMDNCNSLVNLCNIMNAKKRLTIPIYLENTIHFVLQIECRLIK